MSRTPTEMSELSKRLKQWASDLSEWMDTPEFPSEDIKQKVADLLAAADAIEAGEWKLLTPGLMGWQFVGKWALGEWVTSTMRSGYAIANGFTHYLPQPAPPEAQP